MDEKYWWCVSNKDGKAFLTGPYESEAEASTKGSKFGEIALLAELPTRNEDRATRIIKHRMTRTDNMNHDS